MLVAIIDRIRRVEFCKPRGKNGRRMASGSHLPQGNANAVAALAVLRHLRRSISGFDGLHDAAFDREALRPPQHADHALECFMTGDVEGAGSPQFIAGWMRRIDMRAGNPAVRNGLRRRVGPSGFQKLGQNMRMRPLRTFAGRGRDRLIDLDAADPADEYAVRIGFHDDAHRRIARFE